MIPLNETILQTREKRFHLGLQRIILCLYAMVGMFTVNRKGAILNLQYKHLLVTLQRNPHGGPPVPTIDIRPEYVKGFLGTKDLYVIVDRPPPMEPSVPVLTSEQQHLLFSGNYLRSVPGLQSACLPLRYAVPCQRVRGP
jgi:hypothetical protein